MTPSSSTSLPRSGVGRLAIANAAGLVVLRAVFTAPTVAAALRFDPGHFATRPWAALTYPFVHDSLSHLLITTVLLLWLGPNIERRMGARMFLLFYAYVAVGAAAVAVALATLLPVPPMSGALAPVLGVAYARAWFAEDEEVALDPLPLRVRVRVLTALVGVGLLVTGLVVGRESLSGAHFGGFVAAWLFFRIAHFGRRAQPVLQMPIRHPAMAPARLPAPSPSAAAHAEPRTVSMGVEDAADVVNRVLDKISAYGLESLTPQERHVLTQYAERKKREEGR